MYTNVNNVLLRFLNLLSLCCKVFFNELLSHQCEDYKNDIIIDKQYQEKYSENLDLSDISVRSDLR